MAVTATRPVGRCGRGTRRGGGRRRLASVPAGAQEPPRDATVFVHPAERQLGGGRLTLHGVSGRVSWAHNSGRSGVMRVKRLHRWLGEDRDGERHPACGGPPRRRRTDRKLRGRATTPRAARSATSSSGSATAASRAALPKRQEPRAGSARRNCRWSAPAGLRDRPANHLRLREHRPIQPDLLGRPLCVRHTGQRPPDCQCDLFQRSTQQYDYSGFAVEQGGNVQNPPVYLQLPCTNQFNLGAIITSVQANDAEAAAHPSAGIPPPTVAQRMTSALPRPVPRRSAVSRARAGSAVLRRGGRDLYAEVFGPPCGRRWRP